MMTDDFRKIRIRKSPTADTRTADHFVTPEELRDSTILHRLDVLHAMKWFAFLMEQAGRTHDWTKKVYFKEFYEQFHREQVTHKGDWPSNPDGWYMKRHLKKERHHLNKACPEDVNLVDVLEMLCDCVMAGLARNGRYREEEPDADMLVKAYKNTVKKLIECVEIE